MLTNALMTLQRLIDALFGSKTELDVFRHQDDIIIVTASLEEHIFWVKFKLKSLKEAVLTVYHKKCEFSRESVTYLGYIVDNYCGFLVC